MKLAQWEYLDLMGERVVLEDLGKMAVLDVEALRERRVTKEAQGQQEFQENQEQEGHRVQLVQPVPQA